MFRSRTALLPALLYLCVLGIASQTTSTVVHAQAPLVVRIELDDIIQPISADFVRSGIQHASEAGAAAVVIRINTPGGLETSMREMVESILESPVPVFIWVGPSGSRAASAGFFILLSADVAAMAPGTNTGAAHPVSITGSQIDEVMEKKVVSDAAAFIRSYSSKRGRNAALAEEAVTESRSFTDKEALDNNLIDTIAEDIPALLRVYDGKEVQRFNGNRVPLNIGNATVEPFEMSGRQQLLSRILDPNIAFLLAIIGVVGLYVEITHPGLILPGVAGAISLILALFAFNLLPINLTGVVLVLLAIVLFVLEATIASHGILAIGGIVSMVAGGLMLVDGPIPELRIRLSTVLAVAIPLALITVFLLRLVLRSHQAKASTGASWLLGREAVAMTDIHKTGKVRIQGEVWNARSVEEIPEGAPIRITGVDGLTLEVQSEREEKQ